jgi:hypothetical protein
MLKAPLSTASLISAPGMPGRRAAAGACGSVDIRAYSSSSPALASVRNSSRARLSSAGASEANIGRSSPVVRDVLEACRRLKVSIECGRADDGHDWHPLSVDELRRVAERR